MFAFRVSIRYNMNCMHGPGGCAEVRTAKWASVNSVILSFLFAAIMGIEQRLFSQPNVIAWGSNTYGQTNVPPDLTNAIAVAAGAFHSVALRSDGTVVAWGDNGYGQTNVPLGLSNVVAINCGRYHTVALKSDGTVSAWGGPGQVSAPAGLSNVVAVAGSYGSSYALLTDGSIRSWPPFGTTAPGVGNVMALGANQNNQSLWVGVTANGSLLNGGSSYSLPTNFVYALSSGGPALTYEGRVSSIVNSQYLDMGLSNVVAICPYLSSSFLALLSDGTIYRGPASASNVVAIASAIGGSHYLALSGAGPPVFSTRARDYSINYGRTARFYAPATGAWPISYQWQFNGADIQGATTPMLAVSNVSSRDFGLYRVVASNPQDVVLSPAFKLSFLPIVGQDFTPNLTDVVSVASSGVFGHFLALKRDGTVVAWGANDVGQCDVPAGLSNVVSISCSEANSRLGPNHSLALTASGMVHSWGFNFFTNTHPSLTNLSSISAGGDRDAGVSSDGGLATWNSYYSTNFGVPAVASSIPGVTEVFVSREINARYSAVRSDGTVRDTSAPAGVSNIVAISRGNYYSAVLGADGTVSGWGDNSQGQTNVPAGLSKVLQITSTDRYYSIALRQDGTLAAWGAVPPQVSNMVATVTNAVLIDGSLALIGNGPPFVLNRPMNRMTAPGGQVFFRGLATGERPLHYQWQFEGADLPDQTNNVLHLSNVQLRDNGNYALVITNVYGAVTSSPSLLTVYNYALPLGNSDISWTSFGDTLWFPETNVTHDGVSAAESVLLPTKSSSVLRGTLTGPGTLTFWWKIAAAAGLEFLSFYRNEQPVSDFYISGRTDWQPRTVYLGAGPQTIEFVFRTYDSSFPGDSAYVDEVTFTPGTTAPFITSQPWGRSQAPGGKVAIGVTAQGTPPLSYQWSFGTELLPWNSSLTITNMQAGDVGSYSVTITNMAGTVTSTNVRLVLGRIAEWPWSYTRDTVTNAVALDGNLALLEDGTVKVRDTGEVPLGLTNVVSISGGGTFNAAVNAADGTVIAWGDNAYGQTNVPAGLTKVAMVSCGSTHAVALKDDGTLVAWGSNRYGETNIPPGLSNVVYVCAGRYSSSTVALKSDGTLVVWGGGGYGETNLPAGLADVVATRLNLDQGMALHSDGTVVTWGSTNSGRASIPANVSNIVAVACTDGDIALNQDGQLIFWGPWNSSVPPATLSPLGFLSRSGTVGIVADGKPEVQVSTRNPRLSDGTFQVTTATRSARVYRLEYKDDLAEPSWHGLPLVAGNGHERVLSDPAPATAQRFYRVRSW